MGQALLIFVHFSVCDVNSHVNNLRGSTSQTVSGWKFDKVEEGPWTYADVEGRDRSCHFFSSWVAKSSKLVRSGQVGLDR